MQIYILRHGIADVGRPGMSDRELALVPEGKRKLRQLLRFARSTAGRPGLILTSPYRRAVETARIAAAELYYRGDIVETDALRPGSTPEAIWDELRVFASEEKILLTGHEPLLSHLIGFLLGAPTLLVDLKKGSLFRIDLDQVGLQPRGVLRWYLTPKLIAGHR